MEVDLDLNDCGVAFAGRLILAGRRAARRRRPNQDRRLTGAEATNCDGNDPREEGAKRHHVEFSVSVVEGAGATVCGSGRATALAFIG
jgi:hypothetical protein